MICMNSADGATITLTRDNDSAVFSRDGHDQLLPLVRRPLGDELAEELRRLDADQIYADALCAMSGASDLQDRPPTRVHVWNDPANQAAS